MTIIIMLNFLNLSLICRFELLQHCSLKMCPDVCVLIRWMSAFD